MITFPTSQLMDGLGSTGGDYLLIHNILLHNIKIPLIHIFFHLFTKVGETKFQMIIH
jgi:hypothetical protein